jgi:hypothetical protein
MPGPPPQVMQGRMAMRPYADLIPDTREVFGKPVMQTVKNLGGIVATCGIILLTC